MKRAIQILAALLVLQVLLALALNHNASSLAASAVNTSLLAADSGNPDRLTIEGADNAKVALAKVNGVWQLPDEYNYPADNAKVTQLVDKLKGIKLGAAVATTAGALDRFKVAEKNFERRITLANGNKTTTLYFGTSQSAREVHARRDDQKDVFAVDFSTYDVSAKTEDWEDKTVLHVPKDEIEGIEAAGLQLKQIAAVKNDKETAKPTWQADGLKPGENIKNDAVDKLADSLANLSIDSVLGRDAKPDYGLDKPALKLTLVRKGGQRIDYQLGKMADGKAYALKTSARNEYFRLATYMAQPLIDAAKRETLLGLLPDKKPMKK